MTRCLRWMVLTLTTVVLVGVSAGAQTPAVAAQGPPSIGETKVLARVPYPGQPQAIVVEGGTVWSTSAALMEPEADEWPVWAFDRHTGREIAADTMRLRAPGPALMALAGLATDAEGRMYAVDMNGRVLRTVDGRRPAARRAWEVYATIPTHGNGHSHTPWPLGTMPLDIAFDPAGNAYVADTNFPGIWRVPRGGGEAQPWYVDARFQGVPFGIDAIRLGPGDRDLYFAQCSSGGPQSAVQSVIYRLPVDQPTPARLEEVHRAAGDCPDGLAFGASGRLYVANLMSNQILVLGPDGTEIVRFPSAAANARQDIPYDQPGFVAFDDDGWLLVANAALTTPRSDHWAILRAFVGDTGLPLARPVLP